MLSKDLQVLQSQHGWSIDVKVLIVLYFSLLLNMIQRKSMKPDFGWRLCWESQWTVWVSMQTCVVLHCRSKYRRLLSHWENILIQVVSSPDWFWQIPNECFDFLSVGARVWAPRSWEISSGTQRRYLPVQVSFYQSRHIVQSIHSAIPKISCLWNVAPFCLSMECVSW